MTTKVTLNLIADRAKVSRGTVDRVLNQRPHVKPEIRERVISVMKELHYLPPKKSQAEALGLASALHTPLKLGVILPDWDGFFREETSRGIEDARRLLEADSVKVLVEEYHSGKTDEIIECIDRLAAEQVSGIALCGMDKTCVSKKIAELSEKKIPVVTFNSDIPNSGRLCFVGQDLHKSGMIAAGLMTKYLRKTDRLLVAIGNPAYQAHRLREQGFLTRLREKGFSGEQLEFIETYNDFHITYKKVLEKLKQTENICGIYMANESITGCAAAVREAGLTGRVFIISHDLTAESRELLENSELDFVITQNIYRQSMESIWMLHGFLRKEAVPEKDMIETAVEIMSSESLL